MPKTNKQNQTKKESTVKNTQKDEFDLDINLDDI